MRADNTQHLQAAAQRRAEQARQRTEQALADQTGRPLTVAGLARAAGVSRSWLYTQPDILQHLQQRATDKAATAGNTTRASDTSLQRRLELAHARIAQLTKENHKLRDQLARAHGDLRTATSKTASTTQTRRPPPPATNPT